MKPQPTLPPASSTRTLSVRVLVCVATGMALWLSGAFPAIADGQADDTSGPGSGGPPEPLPEEVVLSPPYEGGTACCNGLGSSDRPTGTLTLRQPLSGRTEQNSAWVSGQHALAVAAERIEYIVEVNVTKVASDFVAAGTGPAPQFWLVAEASPAPNPCTGCTTWGRVSTRNVFELTEQTYEVSFVLEDFTGGLLYPGPIIVQVYLRSAVSGGTSGPLLCGTSPCGQVGYTEVEAVVNEVRAVVVPAARSPPDIVVTDLAIEPYTPTPGAWGLYTATVENRGGSASGSMKVEFQVACGDAWCHVGPNYVLMKGLQPASPLPISFAMAQPEGEHELRFLANPAGSVRTDPYQQGPDGRAMESDYSNNQLTLPFSVLADPVRGVTTAPATADLEVASSQTATAVGSITNTGNAVDTFEAAASASTQGWGVTISPARVVVRPGETAEYVLTAQAPARGSAKDTIDVTFTSINDAAATASSTWDLRAHPQ